MTYQPGAGGVKCLGSITYDPATRVTKSTAAAPLAMTAIDTTNLRLTFTAPSSGKVRVRVAANIVGADAGKVVLGLLDGSTVKLRKATGRLNPVSPLSEFVSIDAVIDGLTPGNSYTWDAAYGVEDIFTGLDALRYGGPNDTTGDNANGAILLEVWEVMA